MQSCISILVCTLLVTLASSVNLPPRKGCPEPIDTRPCKCFNSPYTVLECQHIDDSEVLRNVFLNSTRYEFKEVHLDYSVLQYLPHDIFEKVRVTGLYLKNVTLVQLFDQSPRFLQALDTLHIENSKLMRGISWKLLETLTHLRVLNVYYNSVKTLGADFSQYVTKELRQLTLYETGTKSIKSGTFVDFVNLEKIAIDNGKLTTLDRDIFPVPFNVRVLYFNKNKLTTIPDDLFSNMPELQTVGLRHNQIAVIPASAFHGSLSKLEYLQLEGNPLICDCRLSWLVENKPAAISGKCDMPSKLHGKDIKDLDVDFFKC